MSSNNARKRFYMQHSVERRELMVREEESGIEELMSLRRQETTDARKTLLSCNRADGRRYGHSYKGVCG